ncbi:CheY-like superfamily [Penicillium taxi]|uniref:CheY-like superfamily n=1 Tax=Penicillium taxi TaxID=168475 RepID=UPI0025457119|nr:CheY-like superfamily [Penicillium taxi]KAJ5908243.1 CheY-like superfamily [Penicillium taxi]
MRAQQDDGNSRARELFHYFQPDNPALVPAQCKVHSKCATVKSSPNLVLTALAQLAAIKLGVQRTVISLIDRETLYVVAEATQSLSLREHDSFDSGESLWLGCSHGPLAGTLCEKTIALKQTSDKDCPFYIVDDLEKHPTFRHIPCVSGPPHFRYYAGTPLRTPSGINIGSLYVIDPRPNLHLSQNQRHMFGDIAAAVIEYLETSRQSLEADRLNRLLSGLNTFVQSDEDSDTSTNAQREVLDGKPSSHLSVPIQTSEKVSEEQNPNDTKRSRSLAPSNSDSLSSASRVTSAPPLIRKVSHQKQKQNTTRAQQTFQRAAKIMRKSLDVGASGGVIIVSTNDGVDEVITNDSEDEDDRERKSAKVWGHSYPNENDPYPAAYMDSYFVRQMIRRHPRGGLWYFDNEGLSPSSDDDGTSSGSSRDSADLPPPSMPIYPQSIKSLREKDLQSMKKYFPSASRIMFAPLWDSLNSQWFGGCFCWSGSETRVFSAHVDLGGLFGFGASLMVEHSRIQSQESAKQKGDFISTISGFTDMKCGVHYTGFSHRMSSLLNTYNLNLPKDCSIQFVPAAKPLLDTFEQILDFTKINSFERALKAPSHSNRGMQRRLSGENNRSHPLHILKSVDVVAVVEDAVESVYSGQMTSRVMNGASIWHLDQTKAEGGDVEEVSAAGVLDVIINVTPQNWFYILEAGALRRIIMNVFGNALKYTEKGSVSLHIDLQKTKKGGPILLLTISDTGKGMSNEYLNSKVFTPFSQEDPLSPGAGLGLSLVRDILRSLNGSIVVKSQLGMGTVVKINFPLTQPQQSRLHDPRSLVSDSSDSTQSHIQSVKADLEGKTAEYINLTDSTSNMPSSFHMIKKYLTQWFSVRTHNPSLTTAADILVVDEADLSLLDRRTGHESLILVLCRRKPKLWSTITTVNRTLPNAVWLTLPCGPHQLARTLKAPLENLQQNKTHIPHDILLPESPEHRSPIDQPGTTASLQQNGAQFTLTLRAPPETSDAPMSLPAQNTNTPIQQINAPPLPNGKSDLRILLVEDNAINLALLKRSLSRIPTQVLHTAMNGKEAVEAVQNTTEEYHYIFMGKNATDLTMPVMDGFEATSKIRSIEAKRPNTSPAKIIALTGLGSDEHITKAYGAGVNVFLRKPISFKDITRLLEEGKSEL